MKSPYSFLFAYLLATVVDRGVNCINCEIIQIIIKKYWLPQFGVIEDEFEAEKIKNGIEDMQLKYFLFFQKYHQQVEDCRRKSAFSVINNCPILIEYYKYCRMYQRSCPNFEICPLIYIQCCRRSSISYQVKFTTTNITNS